MRSTSPVLAAPKKEMNPLHDPYTVPIAPALYDLVYDQLAKPSGITVAQAINQLLAVALEAQKSPACSNTQSTQP